MRSLGVILNLAQRATASGARIFQVLDRAPRLTRPPGAPALPPGNGHVQLRGVSCATTKRDEFGAAYSTTAEPRSPSSDADGARNARRRRRAPCCTTSTSTCPRAHDRARRRHGLGQDEPRLAHLAAVRRPAKARSDRRRRCARGRSALAAPARSRSSATIPSCSRRRSPRTSPTRARGATPARDRASGTARAGPRVHRAPARGYADARRRARLDPLRRPAPAPGDRTRAARRPARADPR